jgi:malic enzyme
VPISKLALHTACGGVEPATTMPVVFDVGTDNEDLLRSPLYVGVRHRWAENAVYIMCVCLRLNAPPPCCWLSVGLSGTLQHLAQLPLMRYAYL